MGAICTNQEAADQLEIEWTRVDRSGVAMFADADCDAFLNDDMCEGYYFPAIMVRSTGVPCVSYFFTDPHTAMVFKLRFG